MANLRIFDSERLFGISQRAAEQSASTIPGPNDSPIIATLFAAAALEGFVNELIEWAVLERERTATRKARESFASVQDDFAVSLAMCLSTAEELRAKTEYKIQKISFMSTRKTMDKGGQPFQDYKLLFDLRDSIVHLKPEYFEIGTDSKIGHSKHSKLVERLRQRKIPISVQSVDLDRLSWLEQISVPEVGKWAYNAAYFMTQHLVTELPDGQLKKQIERQFQQIPPAF